MRFMGPCCCGASTGCVLCSETFNVADTTDLTTGFTCGYSTASTGNWRVVSNELLVSSSRAFLIGTYNSSVVTQKLSATIRLDTTGTAGRLIIGRTDANNFHYAQFFSSGGGGTMSLVDCTAGTHNVLASTPVDITTGLEFGAAICTPTSGALIATFQSGAFGDFAVSTNPVSGSGWGLGTGDTTGLVTFDDLELASNQVEGCRCTACVHCPYEIRGTITNATHFSTDFIQECSTFNGTYFWEHLDFNAVCQSIISGPSSGDDNQATTGCAYKLQDWSTRFGIGPSYLSVASSGIRLYHTINSGVPETYYFPSSAFVTTDWCPSTAASPAVSYHDRCDGNVSTVCNFTGLSGVFVPVR